MADVLVLCYHAVSEAWPSELAVRVDDLRRQVSGLLDRGYRATTFTDAVEAPAAGRRLAVTFDDGYRSVLEHGLPALQELGVPATMFVPTSFVGRPPPMSWPGIDQWLSTAWESELEPLGWDGLRELAGAGWEIGSHTATHPYLTQLSGPDLASELQDSRRLLLERLGVEVSAIAYPYGDVDSRVVEAAAAAGYRTGAALPERWQARASPLEWPRLMVGRSDSSATVRRRGSRTFRRLQRTRAWSWAPAAARVLRVLRPPSPVAPYPGLRILSASGRVVRARWRVVALLAVARRRGYSLWPSVRSPMLVLPGSDRTLARWMQATFEPRARPWARLAPHLWYVLRARGALLPAGTAPGQAVEAAELALRRALSGARVGTYSPSGAPLTKVTAFVFEAGATEPAAVVKAMADPTLDARLANELEIVEQVRARLAQFPAVRAALPLPPIWSGMVDGGCFSVEELDPMARHTGAADRTEALGWLASLHRATATGDAPWDASDTARALGAMRQAWGFARPRTEVAAIESVRSRLERLEGLRVPRAVVHGDFWVGNVAGVDGRLRVYDWEWARLVGPPFLDLWTYELADLRSSFAGLSGDGLETWCRQARARVALGLDERDVDPRFAEAVMAPCLAELSFRTRVLLGHPGGNEAAAVRLMAVLEDLLA